MQLILQIGSCALAIGTPLRVKVLSLCCELFQTRTTPNGERQIACALTPSSLLKSLPLFVECSKTSDEWDPEATIPSSELMWQQVISLRWPRRTDKGPSMRLLQGFTGGLLADVGVPPLVEASDEAEAR